MPNIFEGALRKVFAAAVKLAGGGIAAPMAKQETNLLPYPPASDPQPPASRKTVPAVVTIGGVVIIGVAGLRNKAAGQNPQL